MSTYYDDGHMACGGPRAADTTVPEQAVEAAPFKWGEDYGKDLLTDLNQLAHAKGTGALFRDALQRAYAEIMRQNRLLVGVQRPEDVARAGWKYVYVKRWRTLIHVPESIADEVRDALRTHTGQPQEGARATLTELDLVSAIQRGADKGAEQADEYCSGAMALSAAREVSALLSPAPQAGCAKEEWSCTIKGVTFTVADVVRLIELIDHSAISRDQIILSGGEWAAVKSLALSAPPPAGWQEIETAPPYSTPDARIWVIGGRYTKPAAVVPDGDYWRAAKGELKMLPTHWAPCDVPMPLPAPPHIAEKRENT